MGLNSYTTTAASPIRRRFGSEARFITSGQEAALIRLWHKQNVQMKSPRPLGMIGDLQPIQARAAQSLTAEPQYVQPIGLKYARGNRRQRRADVKLATFMNGIRRLMKAYSIPWQKLYACLSEHTVDQGNRALVSP
jgi:hypothetical protein